MRLSNFANQNVLITGAASGIGFEFAKLFLKEKSKVILISKNKELIDKACEQLGGLGDVIIYHKDLTDPQTHTEIFDDLLRKKINVNIIINNVGVHRHGKYVDLGWQDIDRIVKVNVMCMLHFCHLFVPLMIKNKSGIILNISATAGFVVCPGSAVYAATKAFVNSFSESLALELKNTGVNVHWICPGATNTNFFKNSGMEDLEYVKKVKKMSAAQVAKEGMKIIKGNKLWSVIGWKNKFNIFISKLVPRYILWHIAERRYK